MAIHRLRSPNELYSFGNIVFPHAIYLNGKFYVTTARKDTGKVYVLVFDPSSGSVSEIELQMPVYPDSTYGSGDVHIIPAVHFIDENTIIAVGGRHVGGTYHVEVVDLVNNTHNVYDSGVGDSTYHIVIRRSDGKFIIFMRHKDDSGYAHLYYQTFDPETGTFGSLVKVTTSSGRSCAGFGLGYDYDTGRYIIMVTTDWTQKYVIEFDVEQMKFYDMNGNELTLPVDITSMANVNGTSTDTNLIKYGGYIYFIGQLDVDGDDVKEFILGKYDLNGNLVSYNIIVDDPDTTNYWGADYEGIVYYRNGKLYGIYTTPSIVKYIEFDENLNITEIYSYDVPSGEAPFRIHNIFVDLSENRYELYEGIATGEDDHDQSSNILEASNPAYIDIYYISYPEIRLVSYTESVRVKVNQQFSINVTLRNDGSESANVYVKLIDHNGTVQDEVHDTLSAGQEKTYTLTGTAPNQVYKFIWTIEYGVE